MEPTSSTPVHPGILAEISGIKITSDWQDPQELDPVEQTIQASEPGQTDVVSILVEQASITLQNANLAQNTGVADDKIRGVKSNQNCDVVIKDVDYDSENLEWDNEYLPQLLTHYSKDSSNKESDAESNDEEDLGLKSVSIPWGNWTPAATPIYQWF